MPDDIYQIRAVISTGDTGLTGRDITPEAMKVLYDKEIEGFVRYLGRYLTT